MMSPNRAVLGRAVLGRALLASGLLVATMAGCQDPLAELEPGGGRLVRVTLTSELPLDQASQVFRLRLDPAPAVLDDLALFRDELSSYYRGRVQAGELPETLAERRVPMLAWRADSTEAFAQPSQVLERGATYSLALMGYGVLARISIGAAQSPVLGRRWPGEVGGAFGGVYCLEPALTLAPFSLSLAPDDAFAEFAPLEFAPECARLSVPDGSGVRVPPPTVGGVLIDPVPLVELSDPAPPEPVPCAEVCVPLGPGCLCAEDDRALVTGPRDPVFWFLNLEGHALAGETRPELPFVIPELLPSTSHALTGLVFDAAGRGTELSAEFRTAVARPRLVINEVYANATGPEPEQEWVELTNAGTLSTTLAGYVLADVGGAALLPDVELPPNGYAVVVGAGYLPEPDYDLVPARDALLVVVDRLGKSGLSNEGEALRLSAPDGQVVSRFPSVRAPDPGVSAARRTPWADDDDPDAFAPHGARGASPGAANVFDASE